jgi:hypothetical protein
LPVGVPGRLADDDERISEDAPRDRGLRTRALFATYASGHEFERRKIESRFDWFLCAKANCSKR